MWRIWIAALLWGLNWTAVKIMLTAVTPWTLRAAGLVCGSVVLAGITAALGASFQVPRSDWRRLVVAAILNVVGFNLFAVFAQLSMPASRAAILTFTMPFWGALFGWMVLGERVDALRAVSLLFGALGIGVLATPFWPVIQAGGIPFGLVYVLGAAISWAAGTVYLKKYPISAEPLAVTTWQVVIAAVVCTAGAWLFETPRFDLAEPRIAAAFVYHVLFPQAVSYVLWFGLIRRVPASTAALGTLLVPIFGVAGAVAILGERPSIMDIGGFAMILIAVALDQIVRGLRRGA